MIEPFIEVSGCILGLALLYYFEIWRPARRAARERAAAEPDPAPAPAPDQDRR